MCPGGRGLLGEFSLINRDLEKAQVTLQKLQKSRNDLELEHGLAVITLQSIGDGVITTDTIGYDQTNQPHRGINYRMEK